MRKLLIIIVAALFSVHNYGQSYHPLPDSNAKWCIKFNNGFIPPPGWWYTNYWETSYSGDTTIDNREYKKIERIEYDIFCLNTVVNGPDYRGAIRDDSINKKVFYIPPDESNEELIYDFNLGLGDTLISYLDWNQPLIVDYVDSILVSGDYQKRIMFQYGEAELIEGIGSRTGLLEPLIAFEGGSYLCALFVDTTLIFPGYPCNMSSTDTCSSVDIESQFNDSEFSIFPNPAKDQFQIKISKELLSKKPRIKIISITGRLCKSQELLNEITNIDLTKFMSGIYIIQVITENRSILNKKLIIEK